MQGTINKVKSFMHEIRCPTVLPDGVLCNKLLAKEYIYDGRLELKCPACKVVHLFKFKYTRNAKKTEFIEGVK